jgi:hypothetical protein
MYTLLDVEVNTECGSLSQTYTPRYTMYIGQYRMWQPQPNLYTQVYSVLYIGQYRMWQPQPNLYTQVYSVYRSIQNVAASAKPIHPGIKCI